jgi:hypothetical protein
MLRCYVDLDKSRLFWCASDVVALMLGCIISVSNVDLDRSRLFWCASDVVALMLGCIISVSNKKHTYIPWLMQG